MTLVQAESNRVIHGRSEGRLGSYDAVIVLAYLISSMNVLGDGNCDKSRKFSLAVLTTALFCSQARDHSQCSCVLVIHCIQMFLRLSEFVGLHQRWTGPVLRGRQRTVVMSPPLINVVSLHA